MLARLVAFPTVSTRSNLDLIGFVEDYLAGHGVASFRDPDASGDKASLAALVGPATEGGVVLSGHTDVVPVDGQPWTADPFTLAARDGRLHGRGACDMKGFLACALAAVPAMQAAGLRRPIILALTRDEEIGCIGAPPMIEAMLARPAPPRGGHRRRAVGDARRHRPEGQLGLPRPGPRPRGAFEPAAVRRLGGHGGRRHDRLDAPHHGRGRARHAAERLRPALHHASTSA